MNIEKYDVRCLRSRHFRPPHIHPLKSRALQHRTNHGLQVLLNIEGKRDRMTIIIDHIEIICNCDGDRILSMVPEERVPKPVRDFISLCPHRPCTTRYIWQDVCEEIFEDFRRVTHPYEDGEKIYEVLTDLAADWMVFETESPVNKDIRITSRLEILLSMHFK
jgi:hypothetical protein